VRLGFSGSTFAQPWLVVDAHVAAPVAASPASGSSPTRGARR
jgi:hypothetical protein